MYVPELPDGSGITIVLIANRGEIASRIIRTCRKLGLLSLAVYTLQDRAAQFWQSADLQHYAGDIEVEGNPYMDSTKMVAIAKKYGAIAVHPGYGFLSENADFAKAVVTAGMTWIGPRHDTIALLGDKAACKQFLERYAAGMVPLVPGELIIDGQVTTQSVEQIGLPVLLKAAAGGGGRGMRVVNDMADLQRTVEEAKAEAQRLFGSSELLLEKYLPACKHVEVQMFGDNTGGCTIFGDRDCSVQRRHQKVIEECPAMISQDLKEILYRASRTIAEITKYTNAATVEFLVDVVAQRAYFLEVNTRIQVEHPVTEEVFGIDLIALQFFTAAGGQLGALPHLAPKAHSIQLRLYAEDPYRDYLPQSGLITYFSTGGAKARFESAVSTGQSISFSFDPLIAKIIVTASDRPAAVKSAYHACKNIICLGVQTNQLFLQRCLLLSEFKNARYNTMFIAKHREKLLEKPRANLPTMIAAVSILVHTTRPARQEPSRLPVFSEEIINSIDGPQFSVCRTCSDDEPGQAVMEIRPLSALSDKISKSALNQEGYRWVKRLYDTKAAQVIATLSAKVTKSRVTKISSGLLILADVVIDGKLITVVATSHQTADGVHTVHLNGYGTYLRRTALVGYGSLDNRQAIGSAGAVDYKAPMSGRVIRVECPSGSEAEIGQCILVLESMKTEVRILSHSSGKVELLVKAGDVVEAGTVLAVVGGESKA